ncbi:gephyrin-like molybdotransferase Glp [Caldimonas brevitalea]|uniref:Molybdopterin molybdenumtransferase n=1 Tax=Caldimonas brevitalea TaxID=413882 RepID=A0A0G3BNM3_9BURK|nr:gephyrin-like molybdotransferase Glp [Caldimonas brevitalea]AKJ28951.1 molybdenum cofactor biosynthesis protein MoaA [Caldimonas brevitalea]
MTDVSLLPVGGAVPDLLHVEQARALIARELRPVEHREAVGLRAALGRVLAADVVSELDVPAHDNSAMDGYAFDGAALAAAVPLDLSVVGTALAGRPYPGRVGRGEAVRIMTGAPLPEGVDTVVPQELVAVAGTRLQVPAGAVRPGDNVRARGEDLARGRPALKAGRWLRPADLGLLASLGQAQVPVWRRLKVACFSTGDELRVIGEPLPPACVHDSNRHTLLALLQGLGVVDAYDLGVVPDDPAALEATLRAAAETVDVVLTSGGVSEGDADHTRRLLERLGQVSFWKLAIRPGRPLAAGHLDAGGRRTLLFGLPGNPVAAMVAFHVFVRDALLTLAGATPTPAPRLRAQSQDTIRKKPGRTEYQRGILSHQDGVPVVRLTGAQGSGILSSMSQANALVVLPHDQAGVSPGDWVDVLPFDGLL